MQFLPLNKNCIRLYWEPPQVVLYHLPSAATLLISESLAAVLSVLMESGRPMAMDALIDPAGTDSALLHNALYDLASQGIIEVVDAAEATV